MKYTQLEICGNQKREIKMSKIKDHWQEEIHDLKLKAEFQGEIEQLESEVEDLRASIKEQKEQIKLWKSIANKDMVRALDYKKQMEVAAQRLGIGWFKF